MSNAVSLETDHFNGGFKMKHCIVKKLIALSLAGLVTGIFSASADAGMDKAAIDALYQKAKKKVKLSSGDHS